MYRRERVVSVGLILIVLVACSGCGTYSRIGYAVGDLSGDESESLFRAVASPVLWAEAADDVCADPADAKSLMRDLMGTIVEHRYGPNEQGIGWLSMTFTFDGRACKNPSFDRWRQVHCLYQQLVLAESLLQKGESLSPDDPRRWELLWHASLNACAGRAAFSRHLARHGVPRWFAWRLKALIRHMKESGLYQVTGPGGIEALEQYWAEMRIEHPTGAWDFEAAGPYVSGTPVVIREPEVLPGAAVRPR